VKSENQGRNEQSG